MGRIRSECRKGQHRSDMWKDNEGRRLAGRPEFRYIDELKRTWREEDDLP